MQSRLEMPEFSRRCGDLLSSAYDLFAEIGRDESSLPEGVFADDRPVSLVFAGQYSAGKSSIIKSLTGIEDIEIGQGITTEVATSYDWCGLKVVDTPGIATGKRPDHDQISYEAIANADLLVYVVTYAGFDDLIARDFRRLLIDHDKAGEMVLIVNKMNDADGGNSIEQRKILSKDIAEVTDPYTPEQLRTVFIDAASYLRYSQLKEEKPERAQRLLARSNYPELVDTLNAFVAQSGIAAQMTTPLYQLQDALQTALNELGESSGDEDIDALEEQLLRERPIISGAMRDIESSVRQIYISSAMEIRNIGRTLADDIQNCKTDTDAEDLAEDAYNRVDAISENCGSKIKAEIERHAEKCQDSLDEFYTSDFSRNLMIRLEEKHRAGNPLVNKILQPDLIAQGSNKIVSTTLGSDAAATGLRVFSGSEAHNIVLNIGHFFGHNFKPWEAVRWAKGINYAGKALGVFGVVLSLGLQAKDDYDAEKQRQQMRKNRDSVRASFNEAADSLETQCRSGLQRLLSESDAFQPRIDTINRQLSEIQEMRASKSAISSRLVGAIKDC